MSHALVEVSTFSPSVVVPDPGDARTAASVETPFQALANRTKLLNERTAGLALSAANYAVSGAIVPLNGKFSLAGGALGTDFALSGGDTVTFATAGAYFLGWGMVVQAGDTANPSEVGAYLDLNGSILQVSTTSRFSANPDHKVYVGGAFALYVAAADAISLKAAISLTAGTTIATGYLSIMRIK